MSATPTKTTMGMRVTDSEEERLFKLKHVSMQSKSPERNSWSGNKIGLITTGQDALGVNAAIRAVVRTGIFLGCTVTYVKRGFMGLVEGKPEDFEEATWTSTSDILSRGGTVIKSFKCDEFKERSGRLKAAKNLVLEGITNLVVIGGDGTVRACVRLQEEWISLLRELDDREMVERDVLRENRHLHVMCVPCSVTNDLCGTDLCIGVDSALHRIMEATDNISTTSSSISMAFVLEVMGGYSGFLALEAGIICDATMIFIPEYPCKGDWREELQIKVKDDVMTGSDSIICIVSEGATDKDGIPITSDCVKNVLTHKMGLRTFITVLGHFQCGGIPSAHDRLLATRLGSEAVVALQNEVAATGVGVVTICENEVLCLPAEACLEATDKCREAIKALNFKEAVHLKGWHFQHKLNTYKLLHSMRSSPIPDLSGMPGAHKIGLLRVGKTTVAQCWVLKAIVGYCQSKHYCPVVIMDGFEGLVRKRYKGMTWDDAKEIASKGNACLGSSSLTAAQVGLEKVAHAIDTLELQGLILLGGFPAYESLTEMDNAKNIYKQLRIPMCLLPMTVLNNIPETDMAIGSDTALNEIMSYCDTMKRAARGYQNCVFIVETAAHNCGYLATIGGLICGADTAYIQQESFNLETLMHDANHMRTKIQNGVKLGFILTSERANENYNTDFIHKLFSEEGKGVFTCRSSTIGHLQVGRMPSALDRSTAICNGFTVAAWMIETIENLNAPAYVGTNRLSKVVLSITGSVMNFEPVSKLVAETDFNVKLPLYMWWMKLRPLLGVLSGSGTQTMDMKVKSHSNVDVFMGGKATPSSSHRLMMYNMRSTFY